MKLLNKAILTVVASVITSPVWAFAGSAGHGQGVESTGGWS